MRLRTVIVRTAAIGGLGLALGLGACAPNYDQHFVAINTRLDNVDARVSSLDMRVQEAMNRADAAGQAAGVAAAEARTANQRVDQLQMQRLPPRSPRG